MWRRAALRSSRRLVSGSRPYEHIESETRVVLRPHAVRAASVRWAGTSSSSQGVTMPIRVLIADDHALVRSGSRGLRYRLTDRLNVRRVTGLVRCALGVGLVQPE